MNLYMSRGARLGLLAFALAIVLLFLVLLDRFGGPGVGLSSPRTITTTLADSQGIEAGADVLVRGVRVGRVGGVSLHGHMATLALDVDRSVALHRDASASIGDKTPLGEAFVTLDPGTPPAGPLAPATSVVGRPSVQFDAALNVLDAPARQNLKALLQTAAQGAASATASDELSATLAQLAGATDALHAVTGTLATQAGQISTTVRAGTVALAELGAHERGVRAIVSAGRRTLAALADRPHALSVSLGQIPGLVSSANATLAASRPLIAAATPFTAAIDRAAPAISGALGALRPALGDVDGLLSRAPVLSSSARPALASLSASLPALRASANGLAPALADVVPMARYLAPRGSTIAAWFANTADLGSHGDARGDWARFFVFFDPTTAFGLPGGPAGNSYTPAGDAAANRAYVRGSYPRLMPFKP